MAKFSIDSVNKNRPSTLELELGDDVVICFRSEAHKEYKFFAVSTLLLPTGRIALRATFDDGYFEDEAGTRYLLDESVGADELVLWAGQTQEVKLKRVAQHAPSGREKSEYFTSVVVNR